MNSIRIASGQGFWGDQIDAPKQQVVNGPIDYLMLDYLAEVTMSIMQKQRSRNPAFGYARDFVPLMGEIFPAVVERGIRVIANAGGVNPAACGEAVLGEARRAGLSGRARVAVITGDDILPRLPALIERGVELRNMETGEPLSALVDRVQSANAYIGARPIVEALRAGAHVVIAGRTTDTALTYAPMIHEFGWAWDDYDRIGAGIVAGHINECGAQASGGNCLLDWRNVPDLVDVGYPIIEAFPDGSFVVTKHHGTGGCVTRSTVTEQLVYEMGDPRSYITPDAIADFTTIRVEDAGDDRVRVHGVRGAAPTDMLKVSIAYADGFKAVGTLVYAWPDAVEKAQLADRVLRARLERLGLEFDEILTEYVGWNATHGPLSGPPPADLPEVTVRWGVRGRNRAAVERFTKEIAPLVLAGPPSVTGFAGGRPAVQEIMAYWPALIPKTEIEPHLQVAVHTA
jgi:hypothetical protein